MDDGQPLLRVSGLSVDYGSITAVRGVDLTVGRGEVVGLIGPNGAGKTTTLGAIAGLLRPRAGTVELDGEAITGRAPDWIVRRGLTLVPEHRRLFRDLTVHENLLVGGVTATGDERTNRVAEVEELFPVLAAKRTTRAGYLSGGEAQQLAIGRALMGDPRVLLMDEPSLGLAPTLVDVVFELIETLRREGRTLLVVEQNAKRMLQVADRAYVMRSGEIAASGSGRELAGQADLFDEYVGGRS
jgi:branched-chain amino acid transport system ATP-binding protein